MRELDTSQLGQIRVTPPDPTDWRWPYRSMDAGGGPHTAGAVGWAWIENVGRRAMLRSSPPPILDAYSGDGDQISVFTCYQGTALLACCTIFRDEMNFAVLVRWLAEGVE